MKEVSFSMKDLLQSGKSFKETEEQMFVEEAVDVTPSTDDTISVTLIDIEEVHISEITDVHGRLSDILESIEQLTGLSVIPLEMAEIAPEVSSLSRHEIFELGGKRYAMSKEPRTTVIDNFTTIITETLRTGVPFIAKLAKVVNYKGVDFLTLELSRIEWTILLSKFRLYRGELRKTPDNELILQISTEHAK